MYIIRSGPEAVESPGATEMRPNEDRESEEGPRTIICISYQGTIEGSLSLPEAIHGLLTWQDQSGPPTEPERERWREGERERERERDMEREIVR
jgi:hypothetical protein